MRKIITIITFFLSIQISAQISKIQLPKGNEEIKIHRATPIVSIYVTKDNTVYLENEEIKISEIEIKITKYRYKLPIQHQIRIKVFMYIDNNANYSVVDSVKTELANAQIFRIVYKTNTIEDKNLLKGISKRNYLSFFHLKKMKKLAKQQKEKKNNNKSPSFLPSPIPPSSHWSEVYYENLYSNNSKLINETLKKPKYKILIISNKGLKDKTKLIDSEKLENIIMNNKVILLNFSPNLKYKHYIETLQLITNLKNKNERFPYFFELSNEITKIHELNKIKLDKN